MPDARKKKGPISFPEGLQRASCTIRLKKSALDFARLRDEFLERKGFQARSDEKAVRGALRAGALFSDGHTHLEVTQEKNGVEIEFEFVRQSHGGGLSGLGATSTSLRILAERVDLEKIVGPAFISAYYRLELDSWRSIVELPFITPGITEGVPGRPKIAGLDFSFPDTSAERPLSRAFVTTYESSKKMVIRLLLRSDVTIDNDLPRRVFELTTREFAHFASPKE